MWGETTRVENRGEMTRGEMTKGETFWGRNVLLPVGFYVYVAFAGSPMKSSKRSPIQVLTALAVAKLRERANHSTSVAIKASFHSKAVEVVFIPINRYIQLVLLV